MLEKERTVTHRKSEKTLEEVGSSSVGEGSAKYSFQRSKRKANATNAMPQIVPMVPIIADSSVVSFGVSSVSPCQPSWCSGKVASDLKLLVVPSCGAGKSLVTIPIVLRGASLAVETMSSYLTHFAYHLAGSLGSLGVLKERLAGS